MLTDLKNRVVHNILISCVDGLKGFLEAIGSVLPKAEVQSCIVHQIRNSLRYISEKDKTCKANATKAFMDDLKPV